MISSFLFYNYTNGILGLLGKLQQVTVQYRYESIAHLF